MNLNVAIFKQQAQDQVLFTFINQGFPLAKRLNGISKAIIIYKATGCKPLHSELSGFWKIT